MLKEEFVICSAPQDRVLVTGNSLSPLSLRSSVFLFDFSNHISIIRYPLSNVETSQVPNSVSCLPVSLASSTVGAEIIHLAVFFSTERRHLSAICRFDGKCGLSCFQSKVWRNKSLVLSNELIKVELPPWKVLKADLSSFSPSSEWVEELWGFVGLYESVDELCHWWKYGDVNSWIN